MNYAYFAIFVRCGIKRFTDDNNSILVAFFNNCHLNVLKYLFYPLIFYGFIDFMIVKSVVQAIALSTIFWMLIPHSFFSTFRYIFAYLCMEYLISLPYSLIDVLNKVMKY